MRGPGCLVLILLVTGSSTVLSSIPIRGGINYNQIPSYQPYTAAYSQAQSSRAYQRAQAAYSNFQAPYVQPRQQSRFANAESQAQIVAGYYSPSLSAMPPACPASCPRSCYPQCTSSCCSLPPPPPPPPPPSCPAGCPKWCIPKCNVECCNPKPPPMPEYLKTQQLTATACEGKKLKITCPNRSDRIIMYSTFYGRDDNHTCHHDVLPSSGHCNEQQHRVNEKVFDLCGHEQKCSVAVNNHFLAADNTTICPGVFKYLKVIYKCSQHPKIFPICPLPCQNPKHCFPKCFKDCCSPQPPKPKTNTNSKAPAAAPAPPPPASCPAACPSYCKPPCTPQCCYGPQQQLQQQVQHPYGVLSSYFTGRPKYQHPTYLSMYRTREKNSQYPQPQISYFSRPYSTNPRNLFGNYKRYPVNPSICPAACRRACVPGCPRHCCTVVTGTPYYGRFLTKLNNKETMWD